MIKKIIGRIFTLCVLVVIVFTVLGYGSYRSLLPEGWLAKIGLVTGAAATTVVGEE